MRISFLPWLNWRIMRPIKCQGDYLQAENDVRQCLQVAVSIDPEYPNLPFAWADLANIARLQGDTVQAIAHLQQAVTMEHTLGHGHPEGAHHDSHHAVLLAVGSLAETQGDVLAAREAFAEIWQQDQAQSHYSAAALIGLGWVALRQEDWSAARRHFAAALPRIEQLETAPQALDALAGIAHLQRQAGQLEQALTLIGLIQHHPSSYQETKVRVAKLEVALRAVLSVEQVEAALARGQAHDLWSTVAVVKAESDA